MTNPTRIVIAAATFCRPQGLTRLLDAIEALDTTADVRVVICDNDVKNQEGMRVVADRAKDFRFPLDCILAPARGISYARNALFDYINKVEDCDFAALIDDDEWPCPQWLTAYETIARRTGADVTGGPVLSSFDCDTVDPVVAGCEQFRRTKKPDGPVPVILSTENVFIKSSVLTLIERPWFDVEFGITGGEDADLFQRLKRAGASFSWADSAEVTELVPASRSTRAWAQKRNFRRGCNTAWRALRRPGKLKSLPRIIMLGLAGIVSYPVFWVLNIGKPIRQFDAKLHLWRAFGYFAGLAQIRIQDYKKVHGR